MEKERYLFENMIASHLLKFVHFLNESEGYNTELNYLRNVDKKEVDFLVSLDKKPWFAVEVKLNDIQLSSNLFYYQERLGIPYLFQVVKKPDTDFIKNNIRVISAEKFLTGLI